MALNDDDAAITAASCTAASPPPLVVQTNHVDGGEHDEENPLVFLRRETIDQRLSPMLRVLTWDDRNHWAVLTQLHGSVWPRVLPLCLVNALLCLVLHHLEGLSDHWDVYLRPEGHKYMAMVMSFLVVTR